MSAARLVVAVRRAGERAAARRIAVALARAQAFAQRNLPFAQANLGEDRLHLAAPGLRRRIGGRLGLRWVELVEDARAGAREARP